MKQFVALLLLIAQAQAGVVLFHDEAENQLARGGEATEIDCQQQVNEVCAFQNRANPNLLFNGIANKFNCLIERQKHLDDVCFIGEVDNTLTIITETKDNKCKDELHSKCGKQIDELKKAIKDTQIIGTLKGAVDVVECIVSHAEDLWQHCKPQKHQEVPVVELTVQEDCELKANALCAPTEHKILGLGYTLGCLAEKVDELGGECTAQQMSLALDAMESSDDKDCHDEVRKKCGKQIDNLKKQIQQTSILGVLKGAVDVVQCLAQNADDLWKKCNPFDPAGSPSIPTKKPTKKPTRKPTKNPTRTPTHTPTTKAPSTKKPTSIKITEAFGAEAGQVMNFNDENADDLYVDVTSAEFDMDECIRAARKYCNAQVIAFNASPFDRSLLVALNECIEVNAMAIESECVVSTTRMVGFLPSFWHGEGNAKPQPCRKPGDPWSTLPVCEPRFHCHGWKRAIIVALGVFVFMVATVKAVFVCRRRMAAKRVVEQAEQHVVAGVAYERIKSDNAPAVPAQMV